jgi:5'-methylthioadenosine phosphorylase
VNIKAEIAIIGGSGLYEMEGLERVEYVDIDTPFGKPSSAIMVGMLEGVSVAFLPRHGQGHRLNPSCIPNRANIYGLKTLGVQRIISISAVGSLKEEFAPLDLVVPDQLIDRTRQRTSTFFDGDMVVHIGFAEPFCTTTSQVLCQSASESGVTVHSRGTMVVMEGPAFSSRAESIMYRTWGADIIGMTALPEAKLAREAEICYATLACVTDYDCWHPRGSSVNVEMVVQNLLKNIDTSRAVLRRVIPRLDGRRNCSCTSALKDAILTSPNQISGETKQKLAPLVGRYLT